MEDFILQATSTRLFVAALPLPRIYKLLRLDCAMIASGKLFAWYVIVTQKWSIVIRAILFDSLSQDRLTDSFSDHFWTSSGGIQLNLLFQLSSYNVSV